jgi:NitT/TauT family transport system ATP-binding protein
VGEPGIEIRGVGKAFGDRTVLEPVSFSVGGGETVTLLGPSGCGKTTLLRIIAGLEASDTGTVSVHGADPAAARVAKTIGFVPQAPALLPWRTVRANARLLRDLNRKATSTTAPDPETLLHDVGLGGFLDAYPHELSGGMQQRVSLVRAFALGPRILLMDEPFAALDELTRTDMRHLLARLCEHTRASVVFVTHSLAEAVFLSDRVVVLSARPGRIVADVPIELPRPRAPELEDDPVFFGFETTLRRALHDGARP